ncbi:hypothetical protein ACFSTC_47075 [Nonomuraea ferruginea]
MPLPGHRRGLPPDRHQARADPLQPAPAGHRPGAGPAAGRELLGGPGLLQERRRHRQRRRHHRRRAGQDRQRPPHPGDPPAASPPAAARSCRT